MVGEQCKTPSADHNGRPIISSKRGRGAGWSEKIMAVVVVVEVGSIHQSISNEGKNWSKSSRWKSCLSLCLGWSFFAACQQAIRLPRFLLCGTTAPLVGRGGGDKPPRPCVDVAHFKYLHLSHLQHLWCALPVLPSSTPTICPHSTFPKCFIHHWEQIYAGRENNGRLSFTAPLF